MPTPLYFLLGAVIFSLACAGTFVFLVDRHCGSEFNYYGCDTPPSARGLSSRILALKQR
jgi:hypothetical protein